jgi:hypothetical protein
MTALKYSIYLLVIIFSFPLFAQKEPVVTEKIDEFDGYKIIRAEKKKMKIIQLFVEAIIKERDTTYRAFTNVFNSGAIVDENLPYRVILTNKNVYDLKIIHASIPSYFYGKQIFGLTFQIPNDKIQDFMNFPITKGRIYYISGTYDDIDGGVIETELTIYLRAVYNRIKGIKE